MSTLAERAADFNWLLEKFVRDTVGVSDTVAVSSDGLMLAAAGATASGGNVEQFAAIVSGLNSLTHGAARCLEHEAVVQVVIEMTGGFLFIARISDGSVLGVLADRDCDVGFVAYEMTLLVERAGAALTPELVAELQNLLVV